MIETLPFGLVDAFAEQPYWGNSAGVVLNADGLSAPQMQLIAREVNSAETAFVSRLNDLHRPPLLRWFTPTTEVRFCGHATLAAAHRIAETAARLSASGVGPAALEFETSAGVLRVTAEELPDPRGQRLWWLQMPDPALKPDNTNPMRTCELLGISVDDLDPAFPAQRTVDNDVIYVIKSWQTLTSMQPRFDELATWCRRTQIRGLCVSTTATLSNSIDVQSRFFAPAVGINEDPVTGSVHGPLAVFLVVSGVVGRALGHSGLMCVQGQPGGRTGLVRALVEGTPKGYRAKIGGICHTTISGEVRVPATSSQ